MALNDTRHYQGLFDLASARGPPLRTRFGVCHLPTYAEAKQPQTDRWSRWDGLAQRFSQEESERNCSPRSTDPRPRNVDVSPCDNVSAAASRRRLATTFRWAGAQRVGAYEQKKSIRQPIS